ncbi:hypothetical protein DES34_11983 [Brevibacillus brevis]|nr:hypothetical protein DES34_11983 [Brevibacillus brevis]VEF86672.1 Uncharacterised protein [Brevibacillus brevis]
MIKELSRDCRTIENVLQDYNVVPLHFETKRTVSI